MPDAGDDDIKDEYDFSKAERGRFCHNGAVLVPPPKPSLEEKPVAKR